MSRLPGRARLVRVVTALAGSLPEQLGGLLGAARFDPERPALARLADPHRARAAADAMTEDEAAWLADLLLERWAAVAPVVLDPACAIVAPAAVWIGGAPVTVILRAAVDGLDPGWRATWRGLGDGDVVAEEASLVIEPPGRGSRDEVAVGVAIEGRADGERVLLGDEARLVLRVPHLVVADDRCHIVVVDQRERPAADCAVRVGEVDHRSDGRGLVELTEPAEPGVAVHVEGVLAGRIPR